MSAHGGRGRHRRHKAQGSSIRLLATSSLANLTVPLSAVVTGPVLARALGPDDRGALAAVLVPFVFSSFLLAFGVPEALTYHVARQRQSEVELTRAAVLLGLITGAITTGALWLLADALLWEFPTVRSLFRMLSLIMPVYMVMANMRAVVIGKQGFPQVNLERWLRTVSRTIGIIVTAAAGALTVTSATWVTEGTALAVTAVLLRGIRHRPRAAEPDARPRREPKPEEGAEPKLRASSFSRYAMQAWLGSLAGVLVLRLDQTLMTPLTGTRQLGLYAVAVAVAEVPGFAIQAITDIVFSKSSRTTEPMIAARVCRCLVVLTGVVALVGCPLMGWGLPFLYGADFSEAVPMAQVLLVGTVFNAVGSVLGYGLLAVGRPGVRSALQFVGVAVNVPLVLWLIPLSGGVGASWASAVTYIVVALLTCIAFSRVTRVRPLQCLLPDRSDLHLLSGLVRPRRGSDSSAATAVRTAVDTEMTQEGW